MARRCRRGSTKPMESNWACANANGCSGSSSSVSASLVRFWPEQTQRVRRRIKKTPQTDGRRYGGPLGSGRSALSAARIALSHVGSAGDQGPGGVPSSDAKERRLFCRGAIAGRQICISPRDRDLQRPDLLGIPQSLSASQCCYSPARSCHQRQHTISSLQTPSAEAQSASSPVWLGLPAAL